MLNLRGFTLAFAALLACDTIESTEQIDDNEADALPLASEHLSASRGSIHLTPEMEAASDTVDRERLHINARPEHRDAIVEGAKLLADSALQRGDGYMAIVRAQELVQLLLTADAVVVASAISETARIIEAPTGRQFPVKRMTFQKMRTLYGQPPEEFHVDQLGGRTETTVLSQCNAVNWVAGDTYLLLGDADPQDPKRLRVTRASAIKLDERGGLMDVLAFDEAALLRVLGSVRGGKI